MGFSVDHAVTRTVRDSAAILDQISGWRPGDTYVAPRPERPFVEEVGAVPGRLLESLGHDVTIAHPEPLEDPEFQRHFLTIVTTAVAAALDRWSAALGRQVTAEEYEPVNTQFTGMGRSIAAPDYVHSMLWLESYRRRMATFWSEQGFDLLCSPVLAQQPPRLGELVDLELGGERVIRTLQFTGQFNVTGQPAASLPLHWTPAGLPIGVQLVADFGREDVLIRVSSQLEQASPWADRKPLVHA